MYIKSYEAALAKQNKSESTTVEINAEKGGKEKEIGRLRVLLASHSTFPAGLVLRHLPTKSLDLLPGVIEFLTVAGLLFSSLTVKQGLLSLSVRSLQAKAFFRTAVLQLETFELEVVIGGSRHERSERATGMRGKRLSRSTRLVEGIDRWRSGRRHGEVNWRRKDGRRLGERHHDLHLGAWFRATRWLSRWGRRRNLFDLVVSIRTPAKPVGNRANEGGGLRRRATRRSVWLRGIC